MPCSGRRAACIPSKCAAGTAAITKSRKPHVFARVHLEIQGERILNVRLDNFLHEFHENGVLAEDGVFVHRLKIDGDEEWPLHFRLDPLAAFDAQHFGNFEELHSRVHHHLLHAGRRDLRFQFVEDDMVNHEGKANRRFLRAVQVRKAAPVKHDFFAKPHGNSEMVPSIEPSLLQSRGA
jgi:hypothetical protein